MVVTSRPSGIVDASKYVDKFVIMNLLPLASEQQRRIIQVQMEDDEFFNNLFASSNIRVVMDALYDKILNAEEQRQIENVAGPNLFKLEDGRYDPQMRQVIVDGSRLISVLKEGVAYASATIRELDEALTTSGILAEFDRGISADSEAQVQALLSTRSIPAKMHSAAQRLAKLSKRLKSEFREFDEALTASGILAKLDTGISADPKAQLQALLPLLATSSIPKEMHSNVQRLAQLSKTLRLRGRLGKRLEFESTLALWTDIARHTDEMYIVGELLFPTFESGMNELVTAAGLAKKCLMIGPLKDPIRIYEKAVDDYAKRFKDGVPPEACITDMLRCLTLCSDGPGMLKLLLLVAQDGGFHFTTADGVKARLVLIEIKNKFKKCSPTHFRNAMLKLLLHAKGTSMFVELQVHHEDIKHTEADMDGHRLYEYFRSFYKGDEEQWNEQLNRQLTFFDEVCKVPVLLSLFVVAVGGEGEKGGGGEGSLPTLPSDLFELYKLAVLATIEKISDAPEDLLRSMLRSVGSANQLAGRRIFSGADVNQALESNPKAKELWWSLIEGNQAIPFVRTLAVPANGAAQDQFEFQFSHLSIQEYFLAMDLVGGVVVVCLYSDV